ncbi:MAG TPA: ATPase domain-containing protein [Kofleriaceae bacterium]|nr:ATPase domain-containing protein [Kofleriaceae bacterium]
MSRTRIAMETTGDAALDDILGGGIPTQSVVIVAGEPGAGKTVVTLQMMFAAARRGKRALYFTTLAEPALKVMRYLQQFEFFDADLMEREIVLGDLGKFVREGPAVVLAEIEARVASHEPSFVVVDSFKVIADLLRPVPDGRAMIYDLAVQMAGWGATTLLVGEYARADIGVGPEFGIADGILRLGSARHELTSVRELEVLKMRGAAHKTGTHFFDITASGAAFFPRVGAPAPAQHVRADASSAPARTGIAGLDELLHGGLPRQGTTLVQGGTGTGKTLIALHFLLEGASRGERGVLFTLEETPEQIRAVARGLGWDLEAAESDGSITIRYSSPVELSTDRYLYEARNEVAALGATRAVFDSLTTMALGVPSERRFKEMVYAITKHLRALGVTSVMTHETPQLLGNAQLTGDGVSFVADNVILLRYVELAGRLERALSVLKARGIKHDSELRAFTIDTGGVEVVPGRFADMFGVLTGIPEKRNGRDRS